MGCRGVENRGGAGTISCLFAAPVSEEELDQYICLLLRRRYQKKSNQYVASCLCGIRRGNRRALLLLRQDQKNNWSCRKPSNLEESRHLLVADVAIMALGILKIYR
ncbi:hypothetical protein OH492_16860 [Vibrio chagasii]|nr:hypothetical protein [Vibrio chagasii]